MKNNRCVFLKIIPQKIISVFISFIISLLPVCISAQPSTVKINASIKGLPAGTWIFWRLPGTEDTDSIRSFENGFNIEANIQEGDAYILRIGKKYTENGFLAIYLDAGTVNIKSDGPFFKNASFSGSRFAEDFNKYNNDVSKHPAVVNLADEERKLYKLNQRTDSAEIRIGDAAIDSLAAIKKSRAMQWVKSHPRSPVSAFVIQRELQPYVSIDKLEQLLNSLDPSVSKTAIARRLTQNISAEKLTGIGRIAPGFNQSDTSGKQVSLSDFRGKYVLLDFWASWCVPCRKENPNLVAAYSKFRDRNFIIVGVSLDQASAKQKWIKAINDDGLNWVHVSDLQFWNNTVALLYNIRQIPANVLIDPHGKILAKNLRGEELDKALTMFIK